jgi:signal transduction histidine kinase
LQEIDRLGNVARRVLDFARPAPDTRYPVLVAYLVQRTLVLLAKHLQIAQMHVTSDIPADLPYVFAAPDQIIQVLLNLTINAIEAMPDGGHLHISAAADGDRIVFNLTNDGPHLPTEHIKRIFDPFFTTKPGGTGLGLSISHSIVQQHGGTITVENQEGERGVAFTIVLPRARLGEEQEAA